MPSHRENARTAAARTLPQPAPGPPRSRNTANDKCWSNPSLGATARAKLAIRAGGCPPQQESSRGRDDHAEAGCRRFLLAGREPPPCKRADERCGKPHWHDDEPTKCRAVEGA